jgi:hypothetical protein
MASKYISQLDTQRFGFPIAKINNFDIAPIEIIEQLRYEGCKLIITKVPLNNFELINSLEDLGFRLKDTQLTHVYDVSKRHENLKAVFSTEAVIKTWYQNVPIQLQQQVTTLAQNSFGGHGHYFANKKLDPKKCLEVYTDWATRSCTDKTAADVMFTIEIEDDLAGFGTLQVFNNNNGIYSVGTLGAVNEKYRMKNIYKMLVVTSIFWAAENGIEREEYSALTTNYGVNRALESIGFKLSNHFATFHLWLDEPR